LRRDAKADDAILRLRRSKQPVGALLLDQRVLAGVGNVFRAEALFVNGINPSRPGRDCSDDDLASLWLTIRSMLRKGVRESRIITVDRRRFAVPKGPHRRGDATYVYHREVCLQCGSNVQTVELAGRACYFCPVCQPS
jgi:formamidopyrimidine-DNA glycosylase